MKMGPDVYKNPIFIDYPGYRSLYIQLWADDALLLPTISIGATEGHMTNGSVADPDAEPASNRSK